MPSSRLVENLKFGWTQYSTIPVRGGVQIYGGTTSDAVFEIDWPIEERFFVSPNGGIRFKTLAWHHDLLEHGDI